MCADGRGVIGTETPHTLIPLRGADISTVIIIQQRGPSVDRMHVTSRASITQQVCTMEIADEGSGPGV